MYASCTAGFPRLTNLTLDNATQTQKEITFAPRTRKRVRIYLIIYNFMISCPSRWARSQILQEYLGIVVSLFLLHDSVLLLCYLCNELTFNPFLYSSKTTDVLPWQPSIVWSGAQPTTADAPML